MHTEPYTHSSHATRCADAARCGASLSRQFIRFRNHSGTHCAELLDGWTTPDGVDLWKLLIRGPEVDVPGWVAANKTRQCSGLDGRCVCAGEVEEKKVSS